jgi:hypothetical protein
VVVIIIPSLLGKPLRLALDFEREMSSSKHTKFRVRVSSSWKE